MNFVSVREVRGGCRQWVARTGAGCPSFCRHGDGQGKVAAGTIRAKALRGNFSWEDTDDDRFNRHETRFHFWRRSAGRYGWLCCERSPGC